jgi:hypothetical protein
MNDKHGNEGGHEGREKKFEIIVNGRSKVVDGPDLCFEPLIKLAFDPVPTGQYIVFTVTYRRGHGKKPEGTLVEGECVKLKDGMVFNVTATDKS